MNLMVDIDNVKKFITSEKFTNFLVSNMIKDITIYQKYVENVVISDVRMPNEIEEIK